MEAASVVRGRLGEGTLYGRMSPIPLPDTARVPYSIAQVAALTDSTFCDRPYGIEAGAYEHVEALLALRGLTRRPKTSLRLDDTMLEYLVEVVPSPSAREPAI